MKKLILFFAFLINAAPVFAERVVQCPTPDKIRIEKRDKGLVCWTVNKDLTDKDTGKVTTVCSYKRSTTLNAIANKANIDHYGDDNDTFLNCYYPGEDGRPNGENNLLVWLTGKYKQVGPLTFIETK